MPSNAIKVDHAGFGVESCVNIMRFNTASIPTIVFKARYTMHHAHFHARRDDFFQEAGENVL